MVYKQKGLRLVWLLPNPAIWFSMGPISDTCTINVFFNRRGCDESNILCWFHSDILSYQHHLKTSSGLTFSDHLLHVSSQNCVCVCVYVCARVHALLCLTTWLAADSRVSCPQLPSIMSLWCYRLNGCYCHLSSGFTKPPHFLAADPRLSRLASVVAYSPLPLRLVFWGFRNTVTSGSKRAGGLSFLWLCG